MAAEQPQSHNLRRSQRTKVTPTSYNDADVFDSLLEEALIEHGLTGRKRSREDGDDVELEVRLNSLQQVISNPRF